MAGTSQTPVGTAKPRKRSNHNIGHGPDNTGDNDCPPQRRTGNPSGELSVARARIEVTETSNIRIVRQTKTKQDTTQLDDTVISEDITSQTDGSYRQEVKPTPVGVIDLAGDYMAGTSQTPAGTAELSQQKRNNHNIGHGPDNTGGNDCPPQRRTGNQSGKLSVARARIEETEKYNKTVGQSATKQTKMTTREPPDTPPEDQAGTQQTIRVIEKERVEPKGQGPG
jgi:hypothetical protein